MPYYLRTRGGVGWGKAWEKIGIKPACNNQSPFELLLYLHFPCLIHKPIIMPHDGFGLKFDTHPTLSSPSLTKKKVPNLQLTIITGVYVVLAWGGASDRMGALGTDDVVAHAHYVTS